MKRSSTAPRLGSALLGAAAAATIAAVAFVPGCSQPPADIAKARAVLEKLFQAETEHRNSHGNFWRDHQATVNRAESMKHIGVDVGEAPGFDVLIEPASDGMDTTLTIVARPHGAAAGPTLRCEKKATDPKPTCTESVGGP